MSRKSTATTFDEDTPLRAADIASGKLVKRQRAPGGRLLPRKQRVNMFLDTDIVEHFKSLAGERGYQTLINEALHNAIQAPSLEAVVRKTIREEMRRSG